MTERPATLSPIGAVTLEGRHVRLVPLHRAHCPDLIDAVQDGQLWRIWYSTIPHPDGMAAEIDRRLALAAAGAMVPFSVVGSAGRIVGMTTYCNIDHANRRLEIGYTWYAARVQRTGLNTEASCCCCRMRSTRSAALRSSSARISLTSRAGARSSGSAPGSTAF